MHRCVAGRSPASPTTQELRVVFFPNDDASAVFSRELRVATQAKIWIGLHEQLSIDRTVWRVAGRAAFAQGFVLEHDTLRLRAMTTRALLIQSRHGESTRRLHDVLPVRVVALHAVHLSFAHGMVLREVELGVDFKVTREARLRIPPRVHDEFSVPAPDCDMFAAGTMTRFATGTARHLRRFNVQARMRTRRKNPRVFGVAIDARRVSHKTCAGNFRRRRALAFDRRTGNQQCGSDDAAPEKNPADAPLRAHECRAQ